MVARFPGAPARILFSHLPPGADAAAHEVLGQPGSKIERLPSGVYRRVIDTRGMVGGEGWWYFASEDDDNPADLQRARAGRFVVRDVPRALLDRDGKPDNVIVVGAARAPSGYEILARSGPRGGRWMGWLLGAKVALLVVGVALA